MAFLKVNTTHWLNLNGEVYWKSWCPDYFLFISSYVQDSFSTSCEPRGWLQRTTSPRGSDQGPHLAFLQLPTGFANGISWHENRRQRIGIGLLPTSLLYLRLHTAAVFLQNSSLWQVVPYLWVYLSWASPVKQESWLVTTLGSLWRELTIPAISLYSCSHLFTEAFFHSNSSEAQGNSGSQEEFSLMTCAFWIPKEFELKNTWEANYCL